MGRVQKIWTLSSLGRSPNIVRYGSATGLSGNTDDLCGYSPSPSVRSLSNTSGLRLYLVCTSTPDALSKKTPYSAGMLLLTPFNHSGPTPVITIHCRHRSLHQSATPVERPFTAEFSRPSIHSHNVRRSCDIKRAVETRQELLIEACQP